MDLESHNAVVYAERHVEMLYHVQEQNGFFFKELVSPFIEVASYTECDMQSKIHHLYFMI